ncbi:MAG: M48 family metalloprotease [Armatimonadetes bacterium]|nr:M48 family metalloprotease [Armatimonadota bacterium]
MARFILPCLIACAALLAAPFAAAQEEGGDPKQHTLDKEAAEDTKLGEEYVARLEEGLTLSEDEEAVERVKKIGAEIALIANTNHFGTTYGDPIHHKFEYTFKVVADEDVNAFSVPGGFIYVNEGLLDFVESDDELAAVLAHEVAHAANRHLITLGKQKSKVDVWTLPVLLAVLVGGGASEAGAAIITQNLLTTALVNGWSQEAEADADRSGFYYLTKSRYHPVALLTFLERLAFRDRHRPAIDLGIMRTHPPSEDRADSLTDLMTDNDVPIERSKVTRSFRTVASLQGDGSMLISFGERPLFRLRGNNLEPRAKEIVQRLNTFFDATPQLFQIRAVGPKLQWNGRKLIVFTPADTAGGRSPAESARAALKSVKDALFSLSMRTFGG